MTFHWLAAFAHRRSMDAFNISKAWRERANWWADVASWCETGCRMSLAEIRKMRGRA